MMEPTRDHLAELARLVEATAPEEIDCTQLLDHVAAYLEASSAGADLPPELDAVRQHLEVCPGCRDEFDALVRAFEGDDFSSSEG